jgi:hypothetical protein
MDWEKSKTYQVFTRFYNEAICQMQDLIAGDKLTDQKKGEMQDKLDLYLEVYNNMVLSMYMNSVTVLGVKRFHNAMIKMGVFVPGDGEEIPDTISLDILEDDFAEAYKEISFLDKQYKEISKGLIPVNDAYKAIKLFQEKFGFVNIE